MKVFNDHNFVASFVSNSTLLITLGHKSQNFVAQRPSIGDEGSSKPAVDFQSTLNVKDINLACTQSLLFIKLKFAN